MGPRRSWTAPFTLALCLLTRAPLRASSEMTAEEFFSTNTLSDSKQKLAESLERFFKTDSNWNALKKEKDAFGQIDQDEKFFFQGYEQTVEKKMRSAAAKTTDAGGERENRGSKYCDCHDVYCRCCTSVSIWGKEMLQGCMEMEYVEREFAIFMTLSINGHVIITRVVSGRNPLPFCARTPLVPLVMFCVRLYDIHHNPAGVSVCARFEVTSMRTILFSVSFDCVRIDHRRMSFAAPPNATTFGIVGLHLGETDPYLSYQDWTKLHFPLPDIMSTTPPPGGNSLSARKRFFRWLVSKL